MSIAALKKVTLAGKREDKRAAMAHLQALGCVHVLPLAQERPVPEEAQTRRADEAYKALRFLAEVEGERRQVTRDPAFDVQAFVEEVLDLRQKLREVGDRRDFLEHRITALEPWGDLVFPDKADLGGTLFWFYVLPRKEQAALDALSLPWEIVGDDPRHLYVVVLSAEEPDADLLPVPRVRTGSAPRARLIEELEGAEIQLESLRAERIALTRYLTLFRANLSEAETKAELVFALGQTWDDDAIFVVQGWAPARRVSAIAEYATGAGLALVIDEPAWDETPPTLLDQPEQAAAGVDLAMFYQVPAYRSWDPSVLLIASFAVFFAMIVADAGYGLVILLGFLLGWRRLNATPRQRAWRRLGLVLAGGTIAYGVLVGSYFGTAPPANTLLGQMAVISLTDFDTMMRLSILIGVAHIVFAIAMNAWSMWGRRASVAQLGWIGAILGGLLLWLGEEGSATYLLGVVFLAAGLLAVVLFTSERPVTRPLDWLWRALDGLQALSGAMGAFGDVLSYMRLFALGLASASLALTFNDLALQVIDAFPGIGLLLGLVILLIGHVLNFGLAMMSGVVHGLRLNYIEFFKWGLPGEGVAFRPLARKEVQE
ncbi:MAG: V-type ATP synthase subunit I [Pseudomonadota bacterium]